VSVFNGGNFFVDPALASAGNFWAGATIHIAAGQGWVTQSGTVTSIVGDTLYYTLPPIPAGSIDIPGAVATNGYYLTGKFQALTGSGQWYRDPTSGLLYLWTPNGNNPALDTVEAQHRLCGFNLNKLSYIDIKGISFFACSIDANGSTGVVLNGITATYLSQMANTGNGWQTPFTTGINLTGTSDSITNSVIAYSGGDGIVLAGKNNTARNNIVHDVDYDGSDAAGILATGSGNIIQNNTVYDTGRDGIHCSNSLSTQVTYNKVFAPMLQTTDGGGIYTYGTNGSGSTIAYNVVYDVHSGGYYAAGIFLDNGCSNYSIHNNIVYNADIALKLNTPSHGEQVEHNDLEGTLWSVASNNQMDLTGTVFEYNVLMGTALTSNAKLVGNVFSGDQAGRFAVGSSLPGAP
jgi:parallel beta-helix repeat protein